MAHQTPFYWPLDCKRKRSICMFSLFAVPTWCPGDGATGRPPRVLGGCVGLQVQLPEVGDKDVAQSLEVLAEIPMFC